VAVLAAMAVAMLAAAVWPSARAFAGAPATTCTALPPALAQALDRLTATCKHALCGQAFDRQSFTDASASATPASTTTSTAAAAPATTPAAPAPACPHGSWPPLIDAIARTLAADGFVLLGEIHDNNIHHDLRAALITAPDARTGLVFEQIGADRQAALADLPRSPDGAISATLDEFLARLDWANSGWAKMADYRPLFAAALAARRPIYAGDPPRDTLRRSARDGEAFLPEPDRTRLALTTPLAEDLEAASLTEIEEAHCGLMPQSALAPMAYAQRYRDAHLADATLAAARGAGAILLTGNGHVRADRGVPWYLARRAPGRPILAVVFTEVDDTKSDPSDYAPRSPTRVPAADWIVLTGKPPVRPDRCEEMRAAFDAIRKQRQQSPQPPKP